MSESKIKKAVIREDLLAITGDFRKAIILNQFIYWSERVSDADKFIEKENEIAKNNGEEEKELFYGWIYKNAEELAEEVMLGLSASQIRRYISDLVKLGYISKRTNPKYKWDRTLQYRVNLVKIAKALKEKGYPLSDYKIDIPDDENSIAHERAINSEPEKNQTALNEQAIPDTTNKDYNAENTDKYAFPDKSVKVDNMYASVSEKQEGEQTPKKKSRYIPKDYTEEQLREHIRPTIRENFERIEFENGLGHIPDGEKLLEDITVEFFRQYEENMGVKHNILPDKSYINVIRMFVCSTGELREYFDLETYEIMIKRYFETDFNRYGKYDGEVTLCLSHFMNDTIRNHLLNREGILWERAEED